MLCQKCNNLLDKTTQSGKLKFLCPTCGTEYKATGVDTMIYSEDQRTYDIKKSGKTIWFYPANQKVRLQCPSCKSPLVAWEQDSKQVKIYGCACGYSWKHVLVTRKDAKDNKDEKN